MVGKIECRTSPEINASVYYDGRKQTNTTPVRLTGVPAGIHTIKYELSGYESSTDSVRVYDGPTAYSTVTLKSIAPPPEEKGKIRCITTPSGANVYFNGRKQANKTPVTLTGVVPNKVHIIEFKKSGFRDTSDEWSVKPGRTIVAERILTPIMQPGYINAISDLPDVTVKMIIEGKTYSYPAPHKFGAPAGRNVVFFSKPDHKQVEPSITVEPRQTVTLKGNPIPIVADTVLILNTLPSEVSDGDKITLSGTLQSKDGKPVVGQIHFYDKDTLSADDELFENNKPLVAMSSSSTGKYSATWTAKKVDSESLIERGTSGAQIYAAFEGTQTHNKSKSMIRNITLKKIIKEGQLRITTRPPGADIYIDNIKQPIGTSAEEFSVIKKLPFGKYVVKTEIKGFDPMEEEVEIKEGPYETVVNHIYEGAKNLCGVLGLETTGLGCVRAILTLPVDLFTPLADAHVIKYHKSMYTGRPEDPTKWTYAAFALGCIPIIGGPATSVGKMGFKLFSNGVKFIKLSRANADLLKLLTDNLFFNRITSMTSSDISKALKLATENKLDELEHFIQTFKLATIPESTMKEWTDNMLKFVDADDIAELKSILKIDVLAVSKIADIKTMFREFLAGTRILTDADFVKLLNQFADSPDDFWELMRILPEAEFNAVIKKVDGLSISDPIGISYFLREAQTKVNTLAALPEFKPRTNKVYRAAAEPNFKLAVSDLAKLTLKDLDLPGKLTPVDVEFMKKFADYTHDALYYIDFDNAAKFSSDTFKTLIASTTKTKPPIINSAVNSNAASTLSKIATDATDTSNFLKDTPKTKLNEVSSKIDFTPYSDLLGDLFAWAKPFDDLPDATFKPVTQNTASVAESLTKFSDNIIPDASDLIANYMDVLKSIRKMKWESPTKMVRSVIDDLPSMSSLETTTSLSKTIKAAPSNMPGLRFVIDSETSKLIDTAALFTKQLPEGSKYIFPVDPSDAENARKIFKTIEMATDFLKKYDSIFTEIRADKFDSLTPAAMDEFIEMLIKNPDEVIPLINKVYETRSTIYHLRPLDDPFIVNFRLVLQIAEDLRIYLGATPAKFADSMSDLGKTAKVIRTKTSKEILESSDLTFDLIESIRRGEGLIAHKFIDILPTFLRNVAKGDVPLVANIRGALKTLLTAILKDAKKSPFFAYWIVFDTIALITFVSWLYLKSTGDEPGTHRFTVNEKSKQLETIAYLIRDVCKTDTAKSSEYIKKYEDVLNSLIEYIESHRDDLTKSEYIIIAEDAIDVGQITLEKFKDECLPAEEGEEPSFPTIPTEISIKLNSDLKSIDSSIWNVKNACAIPNIESATTAYIQTIDLITAFQIYLVKVKSDIGQFTYDGYSMKLGVYQTSLSQAAKCLGADPGLDIPADDAAYLVRGILNAIDSSIFTIKAACKLDDPDELALTITATESLFTEYNSLIATHGEKLEAAGKLSAFNTELESLKTTFNLASKCPEEEPTEENIGFLIREILGAIESGIFNLKSACQRNDVAIAKEYLPTVEKLMAEYTSLRNEYESELSDAGTLSLYDSEFESYQNFLKESTYCIPAEIEVPEDGILKNIFVKEVIDGDTLECRTEDGDVFRVRMVGINTPEKKPANLAYHPVSCTETSGAESVTVACTKEVYQESVSHLWKLVDDKAVTLKMRPDRLLDTTGGRYVADVISSTDVDINLDMVKSGLACYYHREDFGPTEGDVIDHAAYIEARNAARDAKIGIWKVSKVDPNAGYAIFKAYRYKTDSDEKVAVSAEIRTTDDKFLYNSSTTKERVWDAGSHTVVFKTVNHGSKSASFEIIAGETIIVETVVELTKEEEEAAFFTPRTYGRIGVTPAVPFAPPTPPTEREPEAEPWEEFEAPMKILFLNVGKKVTKQTTISTAGQKFIDKHCDLEFEWESEDHDMVELGVDDDDCATLDDVEELTEVIEQDKVPESTKIIYLLWNADEPKCVSYTGFTSGMDDLLFDAILCSSPTSKSKPEFTATTGKLKNDNLDIKYEGSLTTIIQICEALHELYEKTKSDDAEELPEFDDELCKKDITDDRPNAKCVVEWLSKFNDALPDEVKK